MAIHQTLRQTDLEKRLKILRQQVYGRESIAGSTQTHTTNYQQHTAPSGQPTTDVSYLHSDLLKILTFSGVAIGAQIILYFLLKNQVLNINFF